MSPPGESSHPAVNVLTATAADLQQLLSAGLVHSTDLVDIYIAQIQRHNHEGLQLNAMISVAPRESLLRRATELDNERKQGTTRGPLHGIPITVKDNIMVAADGGMPTTVGTYALKDAAAKRNALVVDLLLKAGAIIIGKANLSEMTGWKGFGVTVGWSALGGQTQSPYIVGGFKDDDKILGHSAPGGSSSGSAAGVAAGFAPIALATETDGSIVQPANRAALYGLKATVGTIPVEGTAPWSPLTDSVGGMDKTPADLAALMAALMSTSNFDSASTGSWEGQKIGFVDPSLWSFSPVICDPDPALLDQQREAMDDALNTISQHGAHIVRQVPLTSMDDLVLDGEDALEQLWNHDFANAWATFLNGFENAGIQHLEDMIQFNKAHADVELPPRYPGQQLLELAVNDTLSEEKYKEGVDIIRNAARVNGIDKSLAEHDLDVILGPMDGRIPTIAAAAGYPVGTMPLGYSKTNGRPFGMCIIASAGHEDKILRAMSAWEATMGKRMPPPQMVSGAGSKQHL